MTPRSPSAGLALSLALLSLWGCSVKGLVPLDPQPQLELDKRLIGTFACVSGAAGPPKDGQLNLKKGDPFSVFQVQAAQNRYSMTLIPAEKTARDLTWDAYPSTVGSRTILNAWVVEEMSKKKKKPALELFSQAWIGRDLFQLDRIDTLPLKGEPISEAPALRKSLDAHTDDKTVFTPWLICTRARELKGDR